jgi:hypothetical protein
VSLKSLYRLSKEDQPLERLDLRVAGAIWQVCHVPLSEWIVFETGQITLHRLAAAKQKRLDALMMRNNKGALTRAERAELYLLVQETQEIGLSNARTLATQPEKLSSK